MIEHEKRDPTPSSEAADEKQQVAALPPTGAQPLLLYDLATIVGAVFQQRITVTRQEKVARRFVDVLRPRLHGLPRYNELEEDIYVEMLFELARRLGLINLVTPLFEGQERPYYRPSLESGLEKWSQMGEAEQARAILAAWRTNAAWRDVWDADIGQWDSSDWNPLAARGILLNLLDAGFYAPEQWYLLSPLLDTIWEMAPFILRPARQKARKRTQDFPHEYRTYWNRCERIVYLGILASTLSELGIVSLASHPGDYTSGPLSQPTRFKLTRFGAQVVSKNPTIHTPRHASRLLVVQPTFELILLEFHTPTIYQLLPFAEVQLIEQASRLSLTKKSLLRGLETGRSVEQMLAALNACCKQDVPQNVLYTLRDWGRSYRGAETTEVLHVKVSSEALADELCASPRWREYGLERIAPQRILAHKVYDHLEFRRLLKKAGIVLPD